MRQVGMLLVGMLAFANQLVSAEEAKRDLSKYKVSEAKYETTFAKLTATAQPKKAALGTGTGSSFDLAPGGYMHLHFGAGSPVVEVYPLVYLGEAGGVQFYKESGSSPFQWIWVFSNDKVHFIAGGSLYDFDQSKMLSRVP